MIDMRTGQLTIDSSVVLPGLDINKFKKTALSSNCKLFSENDKWCVYKTKKLYYLNYNVICTFYFNSKLLSWINITIVDHGIIKSWNEWSAKKILLVKELHDNLLSAMTSDASLNENSWGSICSGYDQHSGSCSIVIRYE